MFKIICYICKKEFPRKPSEVSKRNFCSWKCYKKGIYTGKAHHNFVKPIKKQCACCKNNFFVKPCMKARKFCSIKCSNNARDWTSIPHPGRNRIDRIKKTCLSCNNNFYVLPCHVDRKYCSRNCSYENIRESIIKNSINTQFKKGQFLGNKHHNWKGGRKLHKGYVMIWTPNHPYKTADGYVREHRLVMEKYLNRYLDPCEVVHHVNGIKFDNRLENLRLFNSHKEHMEKCKHKNSKIN